MKLNKIAVATSLILVAAPSMASDISLDEAFQKIDVYGSVNGNIIKKREFDHQSQIQLAALGMTGMHETDYGKAFVTLESQWADDQKQQGEDLYLAQANIIFKTNGYGKIVLGNGYKGAYLNLFKPVDIFDVNNQHRSSGSTLFVNQSQLGTNTVSYTTPAVLGGLTLSAGVISAFDDNDTEADNFALRLKYKARNFSLALQRSDANANDWEDSSGEDVEFERYIGMAEYHSDTFAIAATYELAKDHKTYGEGRMWGSSATYHATDALSFKLGYQNSDYDTEGGKWYNDSLYLANVSYSISDHMRVYVEAAEFRENSQPDNVAIGTEFKF